MTTYYQLMEDYSLDYGITDGPKLPDGCVMTGSWVEPESLPELVYEIDVPDDEPCQHFMTGGTVIASQHLIQVLHNAGVTNFQHFPVVLINPDTRKKRTGFFLFNVLGLLKAADMGKSAFDTLMEADDEGVAVPLVAFNELVLDGSKLGGLRMFRLAESPSVLIVDEAIKTALVDNRPDDGWGIMLEEVDVA